MIDLKNWAANYQYTATAIHRPRTLDELRELVAKSRRLKALGTRHSFNAIADTSGELISLEHFNQVEEPDRDNRTVSVGAGVRYGDLCRQLHARGYALHNLASLPHISVAGACATATHGSGVKNGNLATAVSGIEWVTADGEVRALSRKRDKDFAGAVVGLGALGVVTKVTLDILPTFDVSQAVYENLLLGQLEKHFDRIMSSAYSVSLFTDWRGDQINQVWQKRRVGDARDLDIEALGATPAKRNMHPIGALSAIHCTEQMGVPGPWHERLPHFRLEFTPSSGEELQSEYFVPRAMAVEALRAVAGLKRHIAPLLHISEIRAIAADELWLSPHYQRDSVGIHFTWKPDWRGVKEVLPMLEEALEPFHPRPHWGKLFTMRKAQFQPQYERLDDARRLNQDLDPTGKFTNAFLDGLFD